MPPSTDDQQVFDPGWEVVDEMMKIGVEFIDQISD